MDLQIKHAVAVKVLGMTWSRGQFTQNRALSNYSRISVKCSPSNASGFLPQRVRIPCPLRIKSERKFFPPRSLACAPHSFSAFRVPFGTEISNSSMPMNFSYFGSLSGLCSPYYGSISRSFSQIPRAGTRNNIVMTEGEGNESHDLFKIFSKRRKWPKTLAVQKRNTTSTEKALEDLNLPSSNGQIVMDNEKAKETEIPKAQEKAKKQSKSKTKQKDQSSSASASTDTSDVPNSSGKISQEKKTRSKKSKQTSLPSEINLTSGTLKEVVGGNITAKNVPKKAIKNSTKSVKSNTKAQSLAKSKEEEVSGQSDGTIVSQNSTLVKKMKSQGQKGWRQLYPPIAKSVVVVESATKAKVIQGYLGEMYEVLPSYGHVRDLAARSGSVRPDDDFSMVWEVPNAAWSHLKSIKVALSGAENLILASDPDREGEAIAWHIIEMLHQQDALREDVTVARVVFNEITESSIKSALQSPREIDADLVHAYLARRALDYLIGFNVSPLLWRKLPGCQSAGRVQSAALALISDSEKEIDEFIPQEYWTIDVQFQKRDPTSARDISLSSHLTHFNSQRLHQLSVSSVVEAKDIEGKINSSKFEVVGSKTSKSRRNPPTPYITSTLQQDAANKLNYTASYTMKVAQKLYEGVQLSDDKSAGLITYMRTDGLHLSDEAAKDIQSLVTQKYGPNFAANGPRKYFKKVKNAQEAHEAIRPTDIRRVPSTLVGVLDEDSLKLYTLIWCRTMACQMEPSVIEHIQCDIGTADQSTVFRSTSSRVEFQGFQAVYEDAENICFRSDGDDEDNHSEVFDVLRNLKCGQPLCLTKVVLDQHYTQPPARYNEGSLVRKLEELGIGRPSTYATTIKVLKDRKYITVKSRTLYPEFRGRMVSAFLSNYFSEVTDYSFTADMETELDNVSAGTTEWKGLLKDYWTRFSKYCECASNLHIHQVEKMLEKTFGEFLFSSLRDGNRTCPSCLDGTLIFKVSRFGAGYFIGCDQHPSCKYIAKTLYGEDDEESTSDYQKKNVQEPKLLGVNPVSNEKVLLKVGPYGYYVQLGEDRKAHLPKRASVSQIKDVNSIKLEDALELLQYPRTLGKHPDDGQPVIIKLARVGFSVKHRRTMATVPKNVKPKEVTLEKALEYLQSKDARYSGRPKKKRTMVEEPVEVM